MHCVGAARLAMLDKQQAHYSSKHKPTADLLGKAGYSHAELTHDFAEYHQVREKFTAQ